MNKTKDLMFAGYLKVKGYKVVDFTKLDTNRHIAEYSFDIDDATWKMLKLEFDQSDASRIKWAMEQLKDLSY